MAKRFSQLSRGVAQFEVVKASTIDGTEVEFGLRPMYAGTDGDVLDAAQNAATERKATPKDGEPIYDYWMGLYTLVNAAVDPESDPKKPVLFFDGGVEDIRGAFAREEIVRLLHKQREIQRRCNPRRDKLAPSEFMAWVMKEAVAEEGDDFPFEQWLPSLQRSCVRTLASLHVTLLRDRSLSSSGSPSPVAGSPTQSEVQKALLTPSEQASAQADVQPITDDESKAILDENDDDAPPAPEQA